MTLIETLKDRGIIKSKRDLCRLLGRAENRFAGPYAGFRPDDLITLRQKLIEAGRGDDSGQGDLIERVTGMILEPWGTAP